MSTTWPYCSIELIESFLFWVIFGTYNIASYTHSFFATFNSNVFPGLDAKNFETWKNFLSNWWIDCFIGDLSIAVIFLGVHSESIFAFMKFFFFQENCISFGVLVSYSSLSQSAWMLLANLLWDFSWKLLLRLSILTWWS